MGQGSGLFSCVRRHEISSLAISASCRNMAASTSRGARDKQSGNSTSNDESETDSKEFCPGFKDVDSFVKVRPTVFHCLYRVDTNTKPVTAGSIRQRGWQKLAL